MGAPLRFAATYLSFLMLVLSGAIFAGQAYRGAKGTAAAILLDRAIAAHLDDGGRHPPWSWADTHPVALLEVPGRSVRRVVLAGATGASMAFAAGWLDGTAAPNGAGHCVLAGHRDRAFAFLEHLHPGDLLRLTTPGASRQWVVCDAAVVSRFDTGLTDPASEPRLTLLTCYPFDGITASDLRYVVVCRPLAGPPLGFGGRGGAAANRDSAEIPPIPDGRLLLL